MNQRSAMSANERVSGLHNSYISAQSSLSKGVGDASRSAGAHTFWRRLPTPACVEQLIRVQ
eukprot:CAMPEP_0182814192 /NCGR_PEP_ID=MMETSP0006_2-20121128/9728_1 /TAXON_ID=97485 /ORGANISM="Prymnesium parvum, Strain Texoma1" /LENGTH=60 /DNA_ID=CAMNT_0024940311 /DNA_START=447 /DNA_END=629 /DNA_ORIENTATION=-